MGSESSKGIQKIPVEGGVLIYDSLNNPYPNADLKRQYNELRQRQLQMVQQEQQAIILKNQQQQQLQQQQQQLQQQQQQLQQQQQFQQQSSSFDQQQIMNQHQQNIQAFNNSFVSPSFSSTSLTTEPLAGQRRMISKQELIAENWENQTARPVYVSADNMGMQLCTDAS
jgi:multidrug efflux pump subunit AcrA (membrane-fusion protein)